MNFLLCPFSDTKHTNTGLLPGDPTNFRSFLRESKVTGLINPGNLRRLEMDSVTRGSDTKGGLGRSHRHSSGPFGVIYAFRPLNTASTVHPQHNIEDPQKCDMFEASRFAK